MGVKSTEYSILIIVALVAFVAIFAMATSTNSVTSMQAPAQTISGAATSLPAYSLMDYNSDGSISTLDSQLLADAIALNSCITGKICDVDSNGVLDERDLERLNSLLGEPVKQAPVLTGKVISQTNQLTRTVGSSSVTTILA
jgi:hypothetical protein